jgi:hypothetical protein
MMKSATCSRRCVVEIDDVFRRAGDVNPLIDFIDAADYAPIRGLTSPARLLFIVERFPCFHLADRKHYFLTNCTFPNRNAL